MRLMELLVEKTINEGGNAFPNVGTIHIDEINPTLDYISSKTTVKDVRGRVLGSAGKKEYSGDLDIAVEPKTPEELATFIDSLKAAFGETNVRKIGAIVTTSVPIQQYDKTKDQRQPRTGFVQVDYIFGNPEWLKLYFYSPSAKDSALKGTHRNIALATLSSYATREESEEVDDQGRPVKLVRYKWSPKDGLIKISRESKKNAKTGGWLKGQTDTNLSEPIYNADEVANILFRGKANKDYLNSAELIIDGIKKGYDASTQEKIFKAMASGFTSHPDLNKTKWNYPKEIQQYIEEV